MLSRLWRVLAGLAGLGGALGAWLGHKIETRRAWYWSCDPCGRSTVVYDSFRPSCWYCRQSMRYTGAGR